tara:strand:- start:443 stop:961 length:519 start_codon:yes stop_codon:yes gene_type:complete
MKETQVTPLVLLLMSNLKSNKNVKFILPVVIGIWGLFFFRLFDACNPDAEIPKQQLLSGTFNPPTIQEKEHFELIPLERDPFLGTANSNRKINVSNGPNSFKNKDVIWPSIQYLGMVSDGNSKKKIFILSINGTQQLFSQGEKLEGLALVRGSQEKVTLRFEGKIQEFNKIE